MSKKVKSMMEQELAERYRAVGEGLVVSLRGLSGLEGNELRSGLRGRQIRLNVVKNSLARRAFAGLGRAAMGEVLTGPCAIAWGGDSIVDVAKTVVEWTKKLGKVEIRGGFLEGRVLDGAGAAALAKLPNRRELQALAAGQVLSPGARLAGAVINPGGMIAGCIKTLVEKLEKAAAAA